MWVLMSHGSGAFSFDERQLLTAYLDTIGRRLGEFHPLTDDASPNQAAVFLYDLSDPERLASTSAEQFTIRDGDLPEETWTCYGTMSPLGPSERVVKAVMGLDTP